MAFFLDGIAGPAGRQLGRLDFLAGAAGARGRRWARGRTTGSCAHGGLVQRALGSRLGRLGLGHGPFRGLVRDQHLLRGRHHRTNRGGFSLRLAAAIAEVGGAHGLLIGTRLRLGCRFFASLELRGGAGGGGVGRLLGGLGLVGRRLHLFLLLRGHMRGRALIGFALAPLAFLAQAALLGQVFLLAADQLGLPACLFLAARQFGLVDAGRRRRLHLGLGRLDHGRVAAFVALDEGALLAHLDLDGARLAGRVGLLDLAGGFLHQGDLLALGGGRAMAGLEVAEQLLLVGFAERIGRGRLGHARAAKLLKQRVG